MISPGAEGGSRGGGRYLAALNIFYAPRPFSALHPEKGGALINRLPCLCGVGGCHGASLPSDSLWLRSWESVAWAGASRLKPCLGRLSWVDSENWALLSPLKVLGDHCEAGHFQKSQGNDDLGFGRLC